MGSLLYLVITFAIQIAAQDLHTVSIWARNDFKVLRPCVRNCLYGNGDVAPGAGCVNPYYNQCWCSSNIAVSATSYISTCVTSACSDNVDVSTAVAIYDDYCSGAGSPIAGATNVYIAPVDLHTVTIWARNDYKVLRPCVQNCLYGNGDVAEGAGCVNPYYNQCWCSSNIAVSATSYISTCVTNACSDNVDVSTAVFIYEDYCSEAGSPIADAQTTSNTVQIATATALSSVLTTLSTLSSVIMATAIPPSAVPGSTMQPAGPTATIPSAPTATTGPQTPGSDSSGTTDDSQDDWQPTAGQIVGLTFASVAAIGILMFLWFFLKHRYPPRPTVFAPPILPPTPPMSDIIQNGTFTASQPSNPSTLPPAYASRASH